MTDVPDGSGPVPRRAPRAGTGGAPVSGALAIVLAVVAVVAGFLILRSLSDGGDQTADFPGGAISDGGGATGGDGADATGDGDTTDATADPAATTTTTTTVAPIVTEGAQVIVANASGVGGSAGRMSDALRAGPGFDTVDPTNASSTVGQLTESVIYYDESNPAALDVANSLARSIGGVGTVIAMPDPAPTTDGDLRGATVLLMLGTDKADKTLAELAPTTTAAPTAVTNPPVGGSTPAEG